jgi:succinate dehydrogenase/fumarate reductase cytochrome b subunit
MGSSLRPILIFLELIILTAILYSLLGGIKFTLFDFGMDQKYHRMIKVTFIILGCLVFSFLIAHLFTFYPRISIMLNY